MRDYVPLEERELNPLINLGLFLYAVTFVSAKQPSFCILGVDVCSISNGIFMIDINNLIRFAGACVLLLSLFGIFGCIKWSFYLYVITKFADILYLLYLSNQPFSEEIKEGLPILLKISAFGFLFICSLLYLKRDGYSGWETLGFKKSPSVFDLFGRKKR